MNNSVYSYVCLCVCAFVYVSVCVCVGDGFVDFVWFLDLRNREELDAEYQIKSWACRLNWRIKPRHRICFNIYENIRADLFLKDIFP